MLDFRKDLRTQVQEYDFNPGHPIRVALARHWKDIRAFPIYHIAHDPNGLSGQTSYSYQTCEPTFSYKKYKHLDQIFGPVVTRLFDGISMFGSTTGWIVGTYDSTQMTSWSFCPLDLVKLQDQLWRFQDPKNVSYHGMSTLSRVIQNGPTSEEEWSLIEACLQPIPESHPSRPLSQSYNHPRVLISTTPSKPLKSSLLSKTPEPVRSKSIHPSGHLSHSSSEILGGKGSDSDSSDSPRTKKLLFDLKELEKSEKPEKPEIKVSVQPSSSLNVLPGPLPGPLPGAGLSRSAEEQTSYFHHLPHENRKFSSHGKPRGRRSNRGNRKH